jgi:hypothetical protein
VSDIPSSVRRGVYALGAATIAAAVYAWSDPEMWQLNADLTVWMWGFFLTTNLLFVSFLFFTWRRHNWARWATIIWSVLGWAALGWSFFYLDTPKTVDRLVEPVLIALEAWGCYQLLKRSASSWFRSAGA